MSAEEVVEQKLPSMLRENTMLVTSKEGAAVIEGELLDSTRSATRILQHHLKTTDKPVSKPKKTGKNLPARPKRESTMTSTAKEAQMLFGKNTGKSKTPRLRPSPKKVEKPPKVQKETTMDKTAQEGREYLDRIWGKKTPADAISSHLPSPSK